MYGNGCPGPTASGVSTGYTSRSKRPASSLSSSSVQLSMVAIEIPSRSSAGASSSFQSADCCAHCSSTRLWISASTACGVCPSAERTATPDFGLADQAGNPDHEKVVEVRRDDRAEAHPVEQRAVRVERQVEHAAR